MAYNFKSKLYKKFFEGVDLATSYQEAYEEIEEYYSDYLVSQKGLEIIDEIKMSPLYPIFAEQIQTLKYDKLFKSFIHGYNHIERVCLLTFIISVYEGISPQEFRMVLYASMYHDLGRIDEGVDNYHGMRSAEKLSVVLENIPREDMFLLEGIISAHCLEDYDADDMYDKYIYSNKVDTKYSLEEFKKLLFILKDADGLDLVRLGAAYLYADMLRTKTASKLLAISHMLYNIEEL